MADEEKPGMSATERFKRRKAAEASPKPTVAIVKVEPMILPEPPEEPIAKHTEPVAVSEPKFDIASGPKRTYLLAPNKILTTKCKEVDKIDDKIISLAHDMEDFLKNPPPLEVKPIGFAAPQMGMSVRIISCMLNPMAIELADKDIISIVNPRFVYIKKVHLVTETCLSLPGREYKIKRGKIVKIKGMLLDGTPRTFKGHDIVAQMFQHELDHLDGILLNSPGRG